MRKKILLAIAVTIIMLLMAEGLLRLFGFQPGMTDSYVKVVDSLVVHPEYVADGYGIQKMSEYARNEASDYLTGKRKLDFQQLERSKMETTLKELITNFYFLTNRFSEADMKKLGGEIGLSRQDIKEYVGGLKQSELYDFIKKIDKQSDLSELDSAVLDYIESPINNEGFRSIEFDEYGEKQPKVLLLGDSFTWGRTALPLFNSFADILLARGYAVFNTGIVCMDPAQYAGIAKRYVPILKPDVVVVNYYLGNDNTNVVRKLEPNQQWFYFTNAGLFQSDPMGYYMSPEKVYQNLLAFMTIPKNSSFNKLCARTVLTTRLWKFLEQNDMVHYEPFIDPEPKQPWEGSDEFVSEQFIDSIKAVCDSNGAKMLLCIIPDRVFEAYPVDSLNEVFKHTRYHVPNSLTDDDYVGWGDDHFNNRGMTKYADFLQQKMDSLIAAE